MANTYTLPNGVEIGDDGAVDVTVDVIDVEDLAFAHVCRSLRQQLEPGRGLIVTMPAGDDVLGYVYREEAREAGERDELDDTDSLFIDIHALTFEFDAPRDAGTSEEVVRALLARARPETLLKVEGVELLELRDGPMSLITCRPPRAWSFQQLVLEVQLLRGAYMALLYQG
ncbi:hypothetical protein [Pseudoclavibacter helvolus]|uniref:hypothetical protein n=1 Tax=Pseudoclavibacter helvolus TaxID=255205 RepID=UPI003C735837